jgi:hypothetical protein
MEEPVAVPTTARAFEILAEPKASEVFATRALRSALVLEVERVHAADHRHGDEAAARFGSYRCPWRAIK